MAVLGGFAFVAYLVRMFGSPTVDGINCEKKDMIPSELIKACSRAYDSYVTTTGVYLIVTVILFALAFTIHRTSTK